MTSKDTFYFSHDFNAFNDSKIVKIRRKFGIEGYGVYFALLEKLGNQSNYCLEYNIGDLAFDFRIDEEKFKQMILTFFEVGLFVYQKDENVFFSESFMQRMSKVDKSRRKRAEAGRLGGLKKAENSSIATKNSSIATKNPSIATKNPSIALANPSKEKKRKESKVKKSKIKETKSKGKSPFLSQRIEVIDYLNLKVNRKFRPDSKYSKLIDGLLKNDYSVDDCKKVIDNKVKDWMNNPEYVEYLRPETLFGNKFDGYLNTVKAQSIEDDPDIEDIFDTCR